MSMTDAKRESDPGQLRGGSRLRSHIYWTITAFGSAGPIVALLLSGSPLVVALGLAGLALSLIGAYFATGWLMMPVDELRRRLMTKNYGSESSGDRADQGISLHEGGVDLVARLFPMRQAARAGGPVRLLPQEIAEIERLARAGRVSEIAMQSITKDLFRHLSHQLKSPMALLRAHAESARQKVDLGDVVSANESLAAIEQVSMNVAGLVEQLLSMAYVEGLEERGLLANPVNLSSALTQMVRIRSTLGSARGITIKPEIEAGLWVRGESHLLSEMVASLVDNAVRYSPDNTVVRVEAARLSGTKAIVVRVIDQGPGIPAPERERVFEPFYGSIGLDANGNMTYGTRRHRAMPDGAVKSSHGLGLSIVRAVARLHGADVVLEGGPEGRGLSARIVLNSSDPPSQAKEAAPSEAAAAK